MQGIFYELNYPAYPDATDTLYFSLTLLIFTVNSPIALRSDNKKAPQLRRLEPIGAGALHHYRLYLQVTEFIFTINKPYSTNVLDFLNNFYGLFW